MTRWRRCRAEPRGEAAEVAGPAETGAAVVDFVLVSVVLVPLVLGIVQVALVMHVRSTLASAAGEGARYAAAVDRHPEDGIDRTRRQIDGALAGRFAERITAEDTAVGGLAVVEVRVRASVPALGLWGPAVELDVAGHAVRESLP